MQEDGNWDKAIRSNAVQFCFVLVVCRFVAIAFVRNDMVCVRVVTIWNHFSSLERASF